ASLSSLAMCSGLGSSLTFFFFSSRRRHTRSKRDWSSDVCSSDLAGQVRITGQGKEGDGCDGGGLLRQPPLAGGHAQLHPILDGAEAVPGVGAESRTD